MSRRRYLVAYDIRDPGRLRAVHRTARAYGRALQYSVFVCDLGQEDMIHLKWDLSDIINHLEDAVALVDLGDAADDSRFEFLGVRPALPRQGPTIV